MRKILLVSLMAMIFLTGCENKEEDEKSEYLAMKSDLLETSEYTNTDEMMCDIIVDIDRLDSEKIEYSVTLSNPKEDMNDIKAMVVHNYYTEEVFPTIGLFDDKTDLYVDNQINDNENISDTKDNESDVKLTGVIKSTDGIEKLDLELKVLIEYIDKNGDKKDIYYKTTK